MQVAEVATALGVAVVVATAVVVGESVATGDPASRTVNEPPVGGQTPTGPEDPIEQPTEDPPEQPEPGAEAEVTDVTLAADPAEHTGPCPVVVTVAARIRTNTGPVTVQYRWLDGDGEPVRDDTVQFGGPGPQGATVTDSVEVSDDTTVVRRLEVTSPNEGTSDPIEVAVTCTPTDTPTPTETVSSPAAAEG